jgi:UDP-2-acetamido-3-amino-2,3-dideoxy-glucuronate N-acetyltransferase
MNSNINFKINEEVRGNLGVINLAELPFMPRRFFWIYNAPLNEKRAGHAHLICEQILFTLMGFVTIQIHDTNNIKQEIKITPSQGFYLGTKTWLELSYFSENAVLGVWASHEYDRSEYIETFEDFKKLIEL